MFAEKQPSLQVLENGFEFEEMTCRGNRIDQGVEVSGSKAGWSGGCGDSEAPSVPCSCRRDLAGWG